MNCEAILKLLEGCWSETLPERYDQYDHQLETLAKRALFTPSIVDKCSFIGHKLRFAAWLATNTHAYD